ncbi:hypothetical protein ACFL5M_00945 [Candidatus Neomarinimicrobiota bacterium]
MMIRKMTLLAVSAGLAGLFMWAGCEDPDDDGGNETVISSFGDTESHRAGNDCMSCHVSGGSGEGWFTVAGTVYETGGTTPYPNTTVRLYTGAGSSGELVITVEVDANGNFYTTETVDWGTGLYPTVSSDNETRSMASVATTGACNSCHSGTAVLALD